jgi:hypothetical protein
MQLCSDKHEEVCYDDSTTCPVCNALEQVKELEGVIDNLKEEIRDLERASE